MDNVIYWNCASGLVKKMGEIDDIFKNHNPSVFFLAESEILDGRNTSFLNRNGYSCEFSNTLHSRHKSRIMCWHTDEYDRVQNLEHQHNEIIVLIKKSTKEVVVGIYHPFKCYDNETIRTNFIRLLENLNQICNENGTVTIVGDFNVHYDSLIYCPLKLMLENFVNEYGLDQLVNGITRSRLVNGLLQSSQIDLVFSNAIGLNVSSEFNHASDHVILIISKPITKRSHFKKTIQYLDWRNYTSNAICNLFVTKFGVMDLTCRDVNVANEMISNAICNALNVLVPKRRSTIHGKNPVINATIRNLKNKKSRLYKKWTTSKSLEDYENLRTVSQKLNRAINAERSKGIANNIMGDSKKYWDTINELLGNKVRNNTVFEDQDSKPFADDFAAANAFSDFFDNKVMNLVSSSETEHYILPKIGGVSPLDNDVYFTETEVKKAIDDLKRSKAQGHDEIPGCVVKDLKHVIALPLCWLFNIIITTGSIPKAWKIAKILPVFKKGDRSKIENYRPISNNSSLSKIFEKCLLAKLVNLKGHDNLMGSFQHSFRSGCSTTTACVAFHDFISTELDHGNKVIAYSTDLTAAFDLLRPNLLIKRLIELGIPHYMINVIFDFLTGRSCYVAINENNSYLKNVPFGCVQGSVLGPALFNIYVGELSGIINASFPNAHVTAYADDC